MQQQLLWTDLQKGNILENYDEQPKLVYLKDNVQKVNKITFKVGDPQDSFFMIMVGLCDSKIRQERGMIFQDKSFVGHGTYLLYSVSSNSFLFSHWDVDKNYEEGGFNFRNGDTITVVFNNQAGMVTISDANDQNKKVDLKVEHHNLEDLHLCAVLTKGKLTFEI